MHHGGFLRDIKLLSIVTIIVKFVYKCMCLCECDFCHVICTVALAEQCYLFPLVVCITVGLDKYTRRTNNNF